MHSPPYFDLPPIADDVREEVEIMARYDGYIRKQEEQIARMERLEARRIPRRYRLRGHRQPAPRGGGETRRRAPALHRTGLAHQRRLSGRHLRPPRLARERETDGKELNHTVMRAVICTHVDVVQRL